MSTYFYNPDSSELLIYSELKKLLNASFPSTKEVVAQNTTTTTTVTTEVTTTDDDGNEVTETVETPQTTTTHVADWYLVHDAEQPEITDEDAQEVVEGGITLNEEDGLYYRNYVLEYKDVETVRTAKLSTLDTAFTTWREDTATLISSLGFEADADSRAMLDIQGLAILAEADPDNYSAVFMDADNEAHAVTADDVLTLRSEIIQSGTDAYTTKWTLRAAINAAETAEELSAIEIAFTPSDFSTSDEDEEEETTEESTDETTDTGSDSTTDESESE